MQLQLLFWLHWTHSPGVPNSFTTTTATFPSPHDVVGQCVHWLHIFICRVICVARITFIKLSWTILDSEFDTLPSSWKMKAPHVQNQGRLAVPTWPPLLTQSGQSNRKGQRIPWLNAFPVSRVLKLECGQRPSYNSGKWDRKCLFYISTLDRSALSKCKRDRVCGRGGSGVVGGWVGNGMYANGTIKSHSIFMFFFTGNQKTNDTISLNNSDPSWCTPPPSSPPFSTFGW